MSSPRTVESSAEQTQVVTHPLIEIIDQFPVSAVDIPVDIAVTSAEESETSSSDLEGDTVLVTKVREWDVESEETAMLNQADAIYEELDEEKAKLQVANAILNEKITQLNALKDIMLTFEYFVFSEHFTENSETAQAAIDAICVLAAELIWTQAANVIKNKKAFVKRDESSIDDTELSEKHKSLLIRNKELWQECNELVNENVRLEQALNKLISENTMLVLGRLNAALDNVPNILETKLNKAEGEFLYCSLTIVLKCLHRPDFKEVANLVLKKLLDHLQACDHKQSKKFIKANIAEIVKFFAENHSEIAAQFSNESEDKIGVLQLVSASRKKRKNGGLLSQAVFSKLLSFYADCYFLHCVDEVIVFAGLSKKERKKEEYKSIRETLFNDPLIRVWVHVELIHTVGLDPKDITKHLFPKAINLIKNTYSFIENIFSSIEKSEAWKNYVQEAQLTPEQILSFKKTLALGVLSTQTTYNNQFYMSFFKLFLKSLTVDSHGQVDFKKVYDKMKRKSSDLSDVPQKAHTGKIRRKKKKRNEVKSKQRKPIDHRIVGAVRPTESLTVTKTASGEVKKSNSLQQSTDALLVPSATTDDAIVIKGRSSSADGQQQVIFNPFLVTDQAAEKEKFTSMAEEVNAIQITTPARKIRRSQATPKQRDQKEGGKRPMITISHQVKVVKFEKRKKNSDALSGAVRSSRVETANIGNLPVALSNDNLAIDNIGKKRSASAPKGTIFNPYTLMAESGSVRTDANDDRAEVSSSEEVVLTTKVTQPKNG